MKKKKKKEETVGEAPGNQESPWNGDLNETVTNSRLIHKGAEKSPMFLVMKRDWGC